MRIVGNAPFRVRAVLIVLFAALLLGTILQLVGYSPAIEVAAVLAIVSLAFGQRLGWATSVAASVLILLLGNTLVLRLLPLVGLNLGIVNGVLLTVTGLAVGVWLILRASGLRLPERDALTVAGAAVVLPLITGLFALVTLGQGNTMRVGWAMDNDAVWNTVASRFILNDNGIAPWLNPNPSPLVNGLMASWYAPGRDAAAEVLRHDVARQSELLILLFLLCSVLAGIVTARVVSARRPVLRWAAGIFGSAIPLTWYLAGFVIRFGFFNVGVAVAILLAVWLVWVELPRHSAWSIALLLVATTVLLAAWAPLALLSLALAGVAALMRLRSLFRLRGSDAVVFWLAVVQLPLYVLLVTLPDLRRDGAALAANGGVPEITPLDVVLVAVLIFAFATLAAVALGEKHELLGIVILLAATAIGVGYLVWQRVSGGETIWGYYPAKLGWLVSVLLVIVLTASLARWLNHERARGLSTVALVLTVVAVAGLVMAKVPPRDRSLAGVFPLVGIGAEAVPTAETERLDTLFAAADSDQKTIYARYSANPEDDALINYWLLQLPAATSDDPVRKFAYFLDSTSAPNICAAAEAWGSGVVVVTRDPALESELAGSCPSAGITVDLRN